MRISELLNESLITLSLQHRDKTGIIEELLDLAVQSGKIGHRSEALKAILDREALMSTGLEKGIAIPHAKSSAANEICMALGICREGVEFDSADGKPSQLIFFLLAPESAAVQNIKVLGQIARLTSDTSIVDALKAAGSSQEAFDIIRKAEGEIGF
ncbi:PTS sugar transporter subunit IIA [bacterium]|nr:PTS sugar transporter subunit IIA [bacterium]